MYIAYFEENNTGKSLYTIKKNLDEAVANLRVRYEEMQSPEGKLERAKETLEILRNGFRVTEKEKMYFWRDQVNDMLLNVTRAYQEGFSNKDLGTTDIEIAGFRNGEAQKTSARLLLELTRSLQDFSRSMQIKALAEDGGFSLESIGTSEAELEKLDKFYEEQSKLLKLKN